MSNNAANNYDDEDDEITEEDKTPVTIVTGFLGAGKTTLVNYILKEQRDWKICVIENEFGEVSIDDGLVEENLAAREDIIMMDNGCVCCTVRGDLVRTFGMICHKRKDFNAIIIETTGIANPAPILFTFNTNALLQDNFRIDSIVCLVDAKHVSQHLDEERKEDEVNEAENQIAFSDRILLNKIDLVNEAELKDTRDRIRSINGFAEIIQSERSRVPLDRILGLNSFSLEKLVEQDPTLMDAEEEPEDGHTHEHSHDHDGHCNHCDEGHDNHAHEHAHDEHCDHACHNDGHVHDEHCEHHDHEHDHHHHEQHEEHHAHKKKKVHNLSLITSVGFTIDGLLDVATFNQFMSELLQTQGKSIYRSKGILAFAGQGDTKFVFQGVHEQVNFGPSEKPWREDEVRQSKVVFIGKQLDCDYLRDNIRRCTVEPEKAVVTMHKRK